MIKKYRKGICLNTGRTHFKPGHGMNKGPENPMWKGGKTMSGGYVFIKKKEHPNSRSGGYVAEHRLVMEKKIGRYLTKDEIVHHKNGVKTDNKIENLCLMTRSQHTRLHCFVPKEYVCKYCHKKFIASKSSKRKFCSAQCHRKVLHKKIRLKPKKCEYCKKMFQPKESIYRFCSKKCSARNRFK